MAKTLRRRSGVRKSRKQTSRKCKTCKMMGGCACLGGGIAIKGGYTCKMCKKWFKNPFKMKGG